MFDLTKYKGMSHRNVYGTAENDTYLESLKYVLNETYFKGKEQLDLPEGYQHDSDYLLGESFIITDIHYDRESGLIAYGGCYWAGPYNVMVGDFSCLPGCGYPLEGMQNLIDPDHDQYDEQDFERWNEGKLWLKCEKTSVSVEVDEIKRLIQEHDSGGML